MKGIFVGVCNSQNVVPSAYHWSVLALRANYPVHFSRAVNKYPAIRNNQLIKNFLDSDFDIFVKMDIDQVYPPNYFEKMVPLVEEYKIVGPLIFDRWRQNNFVPLMFESIAIDKAYPIDITGMKGVHTFPYCHTNCFYKREVLESIEPPWYDLTLKDDRMGVLENGDRHFMKKVTQAGYKVYINMDVVVQHITENGVDREFYERWND